MVILLKAGGAEGAEEAGGAGEKNPTIEKRAITADLV